MAATRPDTGDDLAACRREVERLRAQLAREREQAADERAGLQLLLDNLPTGVVEYSDKHNLVWANRSFCRMVGLGLEELLGDGWLRTLHPDDAHVPQAAVEVENGARLAIRHVDVDGGVHHCDSSIVHLRHTDSAGVERTRPLVNVHEVTPLHLAQEARLAEERRFRALFDASPIGIVISDLDNVIQDMNPAYAAMLRVDAAELVGKVFHEAHPTFFESFDAEQIVAGLRDHGSWTYEGYMPRFDGTRFWADIRISTSVDASGRTVVFSQLQDHDEVHTSRQELTHAARHDALTGLPNRSAVLETLHTILGDEPHRRVGVLFCDLDGFKLVNDTLGHAAGDDLLVAVAQRLRSVLRQDDHVGRLGGDEFVVLLPDVEGPGDAVLVAERIRTAVQEAVDALGHPVPCGVSVGISITDPSAAPTDAAELLREADSAMYRVKNSGRGGFAVFAPAPSTEEEARGGLEAELGLALERDEFVVCYQPVIRLRDGARAAFEALVRWRHPTRGTLGPEQFLDVATGCGLAPAIDSTVLEQVATFLGRHPEEIVALNVSSQRLDGTFAAATARALERAGVPSHRLAVELRAEALTTDDPVLTAELRALETLGVTCLVDDFGRNAATVVPLHELPVRGMKLSAELTAGLPGTGRQVAGLLGLAAALDLGCIATGVETAAQADHLRDAGWPAAQGWFFGGVAPEEHWFPAPAIRRQRRRTSSP